jgi:hypothetical protein
MIENTRTRIAAQVTPSPHPENPPEAEAGTLFDRVYLEKYLSPLLGVPVHVHSVLPLRGNDSSKGNGSGLLLRIDYTAGGDRRRAVLETTSRTPLGHEFQDDHTRAHRRAHEALNRLARQGRSLDGGAVEGMEGLVSLWRSKEFFHLTEFVEGRPYGEDLVRLKLGGYPISLDRERTDSLADYLAEIHQERRPDTGLYTFRIRELLGEGGSILGLVDSSPDRPGFITPENLQHLKQSCRVWKRRLEGRSHRLRRVHGDFHPWNLLFSEGSNFTALDRSAHQWGDPADDVTCLSMNYLFFALQSPECTRKTFVDLFRRFWNRYLEKTGDEEMLEVAAPYLAFQSLTLANPLGSPDLDKKVQRGLTSFMSRVLDVPRFNPDHVEEYLYDRPEPLRFRIPGLLCRAYEIGEFGR